jgi:hypothetical protein
VQGGVWRESVKRGVEVACFHCGPKGGHGGCGCGRGHECLL